VWRYLPILPPTGSANRHGKYPDSDYATQTGGGRGRDMAGRTVLEFPAVADPQGLSEADSTGQGRSRHVPPLLPPDCADKFVNDWYFP
jgi:hypothetical protein